MKNARRAAALILIGALLLLSACSQPGSAASPTPIPAQRTEPTPAAETPAATPEPEPMTLCLCLAEDSPLCEGLAALAEAYNARGGRLTVELRRFPNTVDMLLAAADGEPALLLLDSREASVLLAGGRLGAMTEPAEPAPMFRETSGCDEGSFIPLGAEAPVLVMRTEQRETIAGCDSFEALCAKAEACGRANNRAWFSADSFAQLFACLLAQKDCPFYADRERDVDNESYREVYNLLAGAAYEGGLVSLDEPVIRAVFDGELDCGICSSTELAPYREEGLAALPLPPMAGCEARVEATVWGLAVTPGAEDAAALLMDWLRADGRAAEAAMSVGLIPAWDGDAEDDVSAGLMQAAQRCLPWTPEADSGYINGGEEFERSFRAALALFL